MTDGGAVGLVARSHHGATLHCGRVGKVASEERAGWHCGRVCKVASEERAGWHCGGVCKVASAERAGWQCGSVGTVSTVGLVARSHQGATLHCGSVALR